MGLICILFLRGGGMLTAGVKVLFLYTCSVRDVGISGDEVIFLQDVEPRKLSEPDSQMQIVGIGFTIITWVNVFSPGPSI